MFIIIVGAGCIGSRILERATKDNHDMTVIEKSVTKAKEISKRFDCRVFNEDATRQKVLKMPALIKQMQ